MRIVPLIKEMMTTSIKRRGRLVCSVCEANVKSSDFKDELSRKEFSLSGLCQVCQDEFFIEDKDDD